MIACLSIPYFVAAVERRAGRVGVEEPLAVGGQPWEARPVYAFSREVAGRGVHSGMSLRLVQLLSPNARFLPAAGPQYAAGSAEVVDVLADFSPDIEPQELWHSFPDSTIGTTAHSLYLPARYCLDLNGLPQKEAAPFIQEMGRRVRGETRFAPAIGLSADPFTAQVAAAVCRPNHLLPVDAGDAADFLASRPLDFLPLPKETARRLRQMGIVTLGQFAALPLPALREQFGRDVESLHRLARGESEERPHPSPAERREEARREFDPPIANALLLETALAQLAGELAGRLQAGDVESRTLRLTLEAEDGHTFRQSVTLRRPTAAAAHLTAVLVELAGQAALSTGIVAIAVLVSGLTPMTAYQLGLFARPPESGLLRRAMSLIAKYRDCGFYRPVLADHSHPLPERRFQLEPLGHDPTLA